MTEYAWSERGDPTYLPPAQLAARLAAAWKAETGSALARNVAELLLAQVLIETDWSRAMWRFNWGNITAGSAWTGDVWRPSWYELTPSSTARDRELNAKMLQGQAPKAFRAYASHDAGARGYVRFLLGKRFAPMLAAAATGSPTAFAAAVRSTRYCPDCTEAKGFSRSIANLQDQIRTAGWFNELPSSGSKVGDAAGALIGIALLWWAAS